MTNLYFSVRRDDPEVYEWKFRVDEKETVRLGDRSLEASVQYVLVLSARGLEFVKRVELNPWELRPDETQFERMDRTLATASHAGFQMDSSQLRSVSQRWFSEAQWAEAHAGVRQILDKAELEGSWRSHLHRDVTRAHFQLVDRVIASIRERGDRFHVDEYEGYSQFWWDADATRFMQYSWGNNPYGGAERELTESRSEHQLRDRLMNLSDHALRRRFGK